MKRRDKYIFQRDDGTVWALIQSIEEDGSGGEDLWTENEENYGRERLLEEAAENLPTLLDMHALSHSDDERLIGFIEGM